MSEWYFAKDDEPFGPVSTADFKQLAAVGLLQPTDLVWKTGMQTWQPASKLKGLPTPPPRSHVQPETIPPVAERRPRPRRKNHMTEAAQAGMERLKRMTRTQQAAWGGVILVALLLVGVAIRWSLSEPQTTTAVGHGASASTSEAHERQPSQAVPDFSAVDYSWDFSQVNYAPVEFSKVEYGAGPNGELIEELDGYDDKGQAAGAFTQQGFVRGKSVSKDEAKWRALRQDALKKHERAGEFVRHGTRIVWFQAPEWPSRSVERREKERGGEPLAATTPGVKRREDHWFNGKLHGWTREWNKDGQLVLEFCTVNGQGCGKRTVWWPNGRKKVEDWWLAGKPHGIHRGWHENGKQAVEGAFVEGREHGKWTYWYPNGNKQTEAFFVHGKVHGVCTEWNENGEKRLEVAFVNGEKVGDRQKQSESASDTEELVKLAERYGKPNSYTQRAMIARISDPQDVDANSERWVTLKLEQVADVAPQSRMDFIQGLWVLNRNSRYGENLQFAPGSFDFKVFMAVFGKPDDGYNPEIFDQGLWTYQCSDGWVRIQVVTNFTGSLMVRGIK